jgi:EmrB/QacA subfamily drug resistance transporter
VTDRWMNWIGGRSMLISLVVAIAFFMENLDATIIVTALPEMADSFHVDATRMSMGVTAYLMAVAAGVTASGWLADRIGCRNLFCGAVALFTLASMLCGAAPDFPVFIIARVIQGSSAAMMSPVGRLVVLRTSEKKDLMRALSALIWPGLAAPVIGPPLGGLITGIASWRWIFYVNLPIGLIGMALILAFIPNEKRAPSPFDLVGFLLTAIALSCLTYGLDLLGLRQDVSSSAGLGSNLGPGVGLIAAAVLLGWVAIRHMRKNPHPLLSLEALRIRSFFVSSVTGGVISRAAISATPFLLPLMFQLAFGLSPLQSGGLLLIYMAANLLAKLVTNQIMRRFGIRTVLVATSVMAGMSIALCACIFPGSYPLLNGLILALAGAGRSLQLTAITMVNFADIGPAQRQPASVFASLTQQIGMGAGVAVGALLLTSSQWLRGAGVLGLEDFRVAFVLAGVLSTLAVFPFLTLARDVGDEISGYRNARANHAR